MTVKMFVTLTSLEGLVCFVSKYKPIIIIIIIMCDTPGECRLSENALQTFDGVSYKLPTDTSDACDVIVARDCSHRGLFTVISSPLTYKVKVILPHYEIKVHVEPSTYAYDIKINGIAKDISSSSRAIVLSEHPTESR
jgi:hypothetical protein